MAALAIVVGILTLLTLLFWFTTQPLVTPVSSRPPPVDEKRLKAHVQKLSQDVYPRSFDHPRQLNSVAKYIHQQFSLSGAQVIDQKVVVEESEYRNIIARFGPSQGPLLVVGAHYDSYSDPMEGAKHPQGFSLETHTPGADDNASSVAGLLELARLLGEHPPSRPVELVAYTLEEPPHFQTEHMGSAWHARSLRKEARPVQIVLALEMIGYFSDEPDSQSYPLPGMRLLYPSRGNYISVVGRLQESSETRRVKALMAGASDLPVLSINSIPIIPGLDLSDHRNYWAEGFKSLMITDTAFYRNPNYHLPGDTYEKLDYRRMAKVVQGVYAVIQGY